MEISRDIGKQLVPLDLSNKSKNVEISINVEDQLVPLDLSKKSKIKKEIKTQHEKPEILHHQIPMVRKFPKNLISSLKTNTLNHKIGLVSEVKVLSPYSSSVSALPCELNSAASTTPNVQTSSSNLKIKSDCIDKHKKPRLGPQNLNENLKKHPK